MAAASESKRAWTAGATAVDVSGRPTPTDAHALTVARHVLSRIRTGSYWRVNRAVSRTVSIAGQPSFTITSGSDQSRYPAFRTTTRYRPGRSSAPRSTSVSALAATESTGCAPRSRSYVSSTAPAAAGAPV